MHWLEPGCLKHADTAQVLKPQLVDFSAVTDKPVCFRATFDAGEGEERNRIKAVEKEGRRMKGVDCETLKINGNLDPAHKKGRSTLPTWGSCACSTC